jgi:hypothetical protein
VRAGFRARARCCACCCTSRHNVVNQHNPLAGDGGVGKKSILRISQSASFAQSMLGGSIATIFQPAPHQNGL